MRRQGQGASGFSLMEVLVGLTLLALISVSVTQSVRTGLRFWSAAETGDRAAERRQTNLLIETWMARALSPRAFDPGTTGVFEGRADRVSFLVDGQAARKLAGYSRFTLAAQPAVSCPGRSDLILTWEDVSSAGRLAASASDSRTLVSCAQTIRFEYAGRRQTGQGLVLVREASWPDEGSLPLRVSIEAQEGESTLLMSARLRFAD